MEQSYWDHSGLYQADFDRLLKLMPLSGNCETVAGELIRCANRLGYDFYNNGMGNNTSGALNMLKAKGVFDNDDAGIYETINEYTRGRMYHGQYEGDALHTAIEEMINRTVRFILSNPDLETQKNSEDLFDFSDEDEYYDEEEWA